MAVTPGERQPLITDGPFARVRHPIYGYQILLMLASLAVIPTVPMLVLAAIHLWLLLHAIVGSGLAPATSGRDSALLGVAGFQVVVAGALLVMLAVSVLWVLLRPLDGRGWATVWNTSVVYGFAAASATVAFAVLCVVPRVG